MDYVFRPTPRASHSAMVDRDGVMWVLGGETFGHKHSWDMVSTFTLDPEPGANRGTWEAVRANGGKAPTPRYGHSAVMHEDKVSNSTLKNYCIVLTMGRMNEN